MSDFDVPTVYPDEPVDRRMRLGSKRKCPECGRVFDLLDEIAAEEWFYGHDCEEWE